MRHYLAAKHNEDGLRTPNEKSLHPFVPNAAFLYLPFSILSHPFNDAFPGYRKGAFVTNALLPVKWTDDIIISPSNSSK